jgi:ubiquinone/menaquinone biosynthesis C-methylase UbiE
MTEDDALAQDWDQKAQDWDKQVGEAGDGNRRLNSDPTLWRMLRDVAGLRVLDAGCGTGYLSRALTRRGAGVVGVDIAPAMIAVARRRAEEQGLHIQHDVDSASRLDIVNRSSMDRVVLNYVLMDLPDLDGSARAMARVLAPGGVAVAIFSHPCFPQGDEASLDLENRTVTYRWSESYFSVARRVDPPWAHFTQPVVWWHRPLSEYVRAFRKAGLGIDAMEEPRLEAEREHLAFQ